MTVDRIEITSLWQNSLAPQIDDKHEQKRSELRGSLLKFRHNAAHLVSRISADLPGLTQHDVSHLDALWETASIICGDCYPLNPLEAFVFGGAVLLHDSALCFEAYNGGLDGVRSTVVWQDHYAALNGSLSDETELKKIADFSTLRSLHAEQAGLLGEQGWADPDTGEKIYLIENMVLRKHLGQLIGQVAASHHWDIEEVVSRLPSQLNALAQYPRDWRIDPIKIACILRCADAAHIDNERAPDFLHALIKRRGMSFGHWQAQNKLACVDLDQSDSTGSTLLFTSTRNFLAREAEAWWIAYDATCMIDREIKAANAVLESRQVPIPQFQVKRVKGVESPDRMSHFIKTEGWSPCVAEIHVGNIEGLVRSLGGEKLYGKGCQKLEVVVRELIQNSRDSVHARRVFEPGYKGRITVRLKNIDDQNWLYVEDDGIGMSKRVLTGPLLDFGTSFWTSSLVQSELPGLRSSKFQSVGRFGVGFYSVFMVANEVCVSSRSWKGGVADIWQLQFNNGLSLRPLLKNLAPLDFTSRTSTQVRLKISEGVMDGITIQIKTNIYGAPDFDIDFSDFVAALTAGIDVSVFFSSDESEGREVHSEELSPSNALDWIKSVSFAKYQSKEVSDYIEKNAGRLRPIIGGDKCHGYAAISTSLRAGQRLSIATVGGLAANLQHGRSEDFIGYIDSLPDSAKREGGEKSASNEAIVEWAQEQLSLLDIENLPELERCVLGSSLSVFGVDPIKVALVPVVIDNKKQYLSFAELAEISKHTGIAILTTELLNHMDVYNTLDSMSGVALIKPLSNASFLTMDPKEGSYNFSLYSCLLRSIVDAGRKVEVEVLQNVHRHVFGRLDARIIRSVLP